MNHFALLTLPRIVAGSVNIALLATVQLYRILMAESH